MVWVDCLFESSLFVIKSLSEITCSKVFYIECSVCQKYVIFYLESLVKAQNKLELHQTSGFIIIHISKSWNLIYFGLLL